MILVLILLAFPVLAGYPQIAKINYTTGTFETNDHLHFRAFDRRAIVDWKMGDHVWSHFDRAPCGTDPNAILLHNEDRDPDLATCVLRIGK